MRNQEFPIALDIRIVEGDNVYAYFVAQEGELFVYQFIGQVGYASEDGLWFELFVSLSAKFDHLAANLPAQYKPIVLEQEDQYSESGDFIGKVPEIQLVRVPRKNILKFLPTKKNSFDLIHSLRTPCLQGKLVRMWAKNIKGTQQYAVGRVVSDRFRVSIHDRACMIQPEENIVSGPLAKYLDPTFVPKRSPSAYNIPQVRLICWPSQSSDLDAPLTLTPDHRLEVSNFSEADRQNVTTFRATYLKYLQALMAKNFPFTRREICSFVKIGNVSRMADPKRNGPCVEHAFTQENSFLSGQSVYSDPCFELGPGFLTCATPMSEVGVYNDKKIPSVGDIIYGTEIATSLGRRKYDRVNLEWLNVSRFPGLDVFIQWVRNPTDDLDLRTLLTSDGDATIFYNLLQGYFLPAATINIHFDWIMEHILWQYKF
uniref:Uncharacterized protein n=1 Tax=viral metagenome TaxID=1070528 RepID=A0A6C0CI81_9ZZZZ